MKGTIFFWDSTHYIAPGVTLERDAPEEFRAAIIAAVDKAIEVSGEAHGRFDETAFMALVVANFPKCEIITVPSTRSVGTTIQAMQAHDYSAVNHTERDKHFGIIMVNPTTLDWMQWNGVGFNGIGNANVNQEYGGNLSEPE